VVFAETAENIDTFQKVFREAGTLLPSSGSW